MDAESMIGGATSLPEAVAATAQLLRAVRRALVSAVDAIYRSSVVDPALEGEARDLVATLLENRLALTERIEAVDQACVHLQSRLADVERKMETTALPARRDIATEGDSPEFLIESWAAYCLIRMEISARQWQLEHVVDELRVLQAITNPSLYGPDIWAVADRCGLNPLADAGTQWPERLAELDALFHANCRRAVALRRLGRGRATIEALAGVAESATDLHREFQRLAEH
ncbi:MAG: hypothetical protein JNK22_16300 [Rhodocyclaceae bacterium]|nr:hypothetical protein [Rhodocyclaceae bacterium]